MNSVDGSLIRTGSENNESRGDFLHGTILYGESTKTEGGIVKGRVTVTGGGCTPECGEGSVQKRGMAEGIVMKAAVPVTVMAVARRG